MSRARDIAIPLVITTVLFACTTLFRTGVLDGRSRARQQFGLSQDVVSSPGAEVLSLLSMQHPTLFADLVWLQIVQNLGAHEASVPAIADRVEQWSDIASDLEPGYFEVQYYPAVVLTMYSRRVEASDRIASKGERNLPERWEFPFLLGYNSYFVHGDTIAAGEHWLRAARIPGVPRYIPSLVARSRIHAGDPREAIALLESMLEWLPAGPHREDAEIRLAIINSELYVLPKYDEACLKVRAETGRVPTAKELFDAGLVSVPPQDLLGKDIELDQDCRARTEIIVVREDEAAQRVGSLRDKENPSSVKVTEE